MTYPQAVSHGGGCCGVIHLRRFDHIFNRMTDEALLEQIRMQLATYINRQNNNRLVEVVLTDGQCQKFQGQFPRILRILGFKLVNRFKNSNSGNVCNVFHMIATPLPLDNLPFEWGPPIIPEATFHRVYRGRTGATGYPTLEAARDGAKDTLERVVKKTLGQPDEVVWRLHPEVKNPFAR